MRKQFDIKYRPQIESGEYKVETRDGRKARIIDWDLNCASPIVAVMDVHIDLPGEIVDVFSVSGRAFDDLESPSDLFIVTPEEELTEFEKKLWEVLKSEGSPIGPIEKFTNADKEVFHSYAAKLLALAIDAHARELYKGLNQSKLDKDSIPYHLIEFMCNLYTCQNWKEIEEIAEAYKTRIKAAALKDLPRWRKWENGACGNGRGIPLAIVKRGLNGYELVDALGIQGEQYIMLSDLEKLPVFNE